MQKIVTYIILVIVGVSIGAAGIGYFALNQSPALNEEVKVTIQDIEYVESDYPVMEISLLNDAPEKNLEGSVIITQANNEWTNQVTWYYTGQGETAILCDGINKDQSFQIKYEEKNSKATYLNRAIQWTEVKKDESTIGFMETKELTIKSVSFTDDGSGNKRIDVEVWNSGTAKITISQIKINGNTITADKWRMTSGKPTIDSGDSDKVEITSDYIAGNKYSITFFLSDGTMIATYTDTA